MLWVEKTGNSNSVLAMFNDEDLSSVKQVNHSLRHIIDQLTAATVAAHILTLKYQISK